MSCVPRRPARTPPRYPPPIQAIAALSSRTSRRATVQPDAARAKGSDLQQTAGHGQVLHEVDELIPVTQRMVEDDRSEHAEDRKRSRYRFRAVAHEQQHSAAHLDDERDDVREHRSRQTYRSDVVLDRAGRAELSQATHDEHGPQQDPTDESQRGLIAVRTTV